MHRRRIRRRVRKEVRVAIMDKLRIMFQRVDPFFDGRARVCHNDEWFHVCCGTPAYEEKYAYVGNFSGGRANVLDRSGKWFAINLNGKKSHF